MKRRTKSMIVFSKSRLFKSLLMLD